VEVLADRDLLPLNQLVSTLSFSLVVELRCIQIVRGPQDPHFFSHPLLLLVKFYLFKNWVRLPRSKWLLMLLSASKYRVLDARDRVLCLQKAAVLLSLLVLLPQVHQAWLHRRGFVQ
jgi:hypothetical protein